MKTILCYGDSNTWGYIPGGSGTQRFAPGIRWPGIMRNLLPTDYYVVESGLNGRTTIWENPWEPWRNGRTTLVPAMMAASPLDLVILMLGTNDLLDHTAWEAGQASFALLREIRRQPDLFSSGKPLALLVSPPLIVGPLSFAAQPPSGIDMAAESEKFSGYYHQNALRAGMPFFDAARAAAPAQEGAALQGGGIGDGIHLSAEGHRKLGEALAREVRRLLP